MLKNKQRHNSTVSKVSYDSPLYFSLEEVYNYIFNMNTEVIGKLADEACPVLAPSREQVRVREDRYFDAQLAFMEQSGTKDSKASNGPFAGEFDRFVLRLRNVLDDERMSFLLKPRKENGDEFKTGDLQDLIAELIGYVEQGKSNVTIIDLSGIPFEVLSLVVSLISRIVFDVGFHLKKSGATKDDGTNIPLLVVYEEAHIMRPIRSLYGIGRSRRQWKGSQRKGGSMVSR